MFGLRKWRLGKELADYKAHKIKKQSGAYEDPEPRRIRGKKRVSSGKLCKKTKGEHVWKLMKVHKHQFMSDSYNFYKCEKCCKEHWQQKSSYICADCGGESSWLHHVFSNRDKRVCRKCGSENIKTIPNPILGERE